MKKTLTILFLIVYTLLGAGVSVVIHTCGGVSDAALASAQYEDPCGCDDGTSAEMCCTTVMTTVKVEDAQQTPTAPMLQTDSAGQPHPAPPVPSLTEPAFAGVPFFDSSPPLTYDLTVLHSVFRI